MRGKRLLMAAALGLASLILPIAAQPASAAIETERDNTVNSGIFVVGFCKSLTGARVCFGDDGDYWSVDDTSADGHSAAAEWENYVATGTRGTYELYRRGFCIQTNGNGAEGTCNKNYQEGSRIRFKACTYESSTKSPYQCTGWSDWQRA